jgi:hypothetical protein
MVLGSPEAGRAQSGVRGQARAVQTTVFSLLGNTSATLADTGTLNDSTDAREASQGVGSVSTVFSGETLHATTIGWPDQVVSEASVADVAISIAGMAIGADFVMSRARAVQGVPARGATTVDGLSVNGVGILVTGEPNQTVSIPGGRVVINEQQTSAGGTVVNGLHVVVDGVADVVIASATAGLR